MFRKKNSRRLCVLCCLSVDLKQDEDTKANLERRMGVRRDWPNCLAAENLERYYFPYPDRFLEILLGLLGESWVLIRVLRDSWGLLRW